MNPLGQLPASQSPQFSLNALDAQKILRFLLVQILGLVVSLGAKWLLGFHYVYAGQDYTAEVVMAVNTVAELARRFVSGVKNPAG